MWHPFETREVGRDIATIAVGDLVSVPFNVACGLCRPLGSALAQTAYIDRTFRGNNRYSATGQLAIGLVSAVLGSAASSASLSSRLH